MSFQEHRDSQGCLHKQLKKKREKNRFILHKILNYIARNQNNILKNVTSFLTASKFIKLGLIKKFIHEKGCLKECCKLNGHSKYSY